MVRGFLQANDRMDFIAWGGMGLWWDHIAEAYPWLERLYLTADTTPPPAWLGGFVDFSEAERSAFIALTYNSPEIQRLNQPLFPADIY